FQEDIDILILGSSLAYRGIDTRIFEAKGYKAFNLGTSAQTPLQTKLLLEYYLEELTPQQVIYVVSPNDFTGNGLESSLDIVANLPEIHLSVFKLLQDIPNIKLFNTILFSWLNNKIDRSDYAEPAIKGMDIYVGDGGFVQRGLSYYSDQKQIRSRSLPSKERQMNVLEGIIKKFRNEGIDLILVRPPITRNSYESITSNTEFNKRISQLGSFKDYNLNLELVDSLHFYDSQHLNQIGVRKFTNAILNDLEIQNLQINY
ncbi:hypothetical protein, partial [Longispora fulva]|uniref:hypothetical protein n=2 Tax=Bacteria TaxID=2 RepID=UPI003627FF26